MLGIGNPGKKYEETRHNIGYRVVEVLAERQAPGSKTAWTDDKRFQAKVFKTESVWFLKSSLYVNNTGGTAVALVAGSGASPAELLVVCDDVNLVLGKIRLRESGSAGGHHGLESVIQELGSEDFPRLRVGVGNASMPKDLAGFVLEPFDPGEQERLSEVIEKTVLICETWVNEGFEGAMNHLSRLQSIK